MCGIAGIFDPAGKSSREDLRSQAAAMAGTLRHRGPDDEGAWVDTGGLAAFGFSRLSILDLSAAGHQPMTSVSGRFTIVFNGEIYNVEELRQELCSKDSSLKFRGHSDTEVMLAAFEAWEVERALEKFNGMFAFAVWDSQTRALQLARDRLGEKPLYFGWFGETLLFASELKALRRHPAFDDEVDRGGLALLLRYNCIPAPFTIYSLVRKLPPATLLSIKDRSHAIERRYWSLQDAMDHGHSQPFQGSPAAAVDELESLLRDAVKLRMIADVPLGAFLSGGVDSSTVVALMQSVSNRPVNTFTIGVTESSCDEAQDARAVAAHLGTNHTELYVTPEEVQSVIPRLAEIYDEPFADSSQLPTYLVAALARKHVTVALSGDGGDEIFGGYNRYLWLQRVWKSSAWMPLPVRRAAAGVIRGVSVGAWDALYKIAAPVLPVRWQQRLPGEKLHKIAGVINAPDPPTMYICLASHWQQPEDVIAGASEPVTAMRNGGASSVTSDLVEQMMYLDAISYLPDDILVKLDRASMAVSLEARVPILDHRVIEFACRLPMSLKIRDGCGKWILRQVLFRYVPAQLVERPKMGFGVPLHAWLRGPLRPWAQALLDPSRLRNEGFIDPRAVSEKWSEHLSGKRDWGYHLWDVLMFQAWLETSRSPLEVAVGAE
jgi:asparagine synthase (glutamine-hydrolysing)